MICLYRKYICVFFISLLAINQTFHLFHIAFAHHDERCSHHHNHQVKILDYSSSINTLNEHCIICDLDVFNLFEASLFITTRTVRHHITQLNIGDLFSGMADNWVTTSLHQRGPPLKS